MWFPFLFYPDSPPEEWSSSLWPGDGAGILQGLDPSPGAVSCSSGPIREQTVVTWCPAAQPGAGTEDGSAWGETFIHESSVFVSGSSQLSGTHTHTHLHTSSSCLLSPGLSFMLPTQIQWIQNGLTYVLCVLISAGWPEAAAGLLFSPGLSGQEPGDVAAESGDGSQVSEGGSGKTLTLLN